MQEVVLMSSQKTRLRFSLLFLMACLVSCDDDGGDSRTEQITPGMTRQALLAVLQQPAAGGPPVAGDSLTNIWRTASYLTDGRVLEIIWYSRENERRSAADTVPEKPVYPVVLADGVVIGTGRSVMDSLARLGRVPPNKY
jgi:hypothetical protein